jgi:hypothetical protein
MRPSIKDLARIMSCLSRFILLSAGVLLQIASGLDDWLRFAMLGVPPYAGNLVKTVVFPFASWQSVRNQKLFPS